MFGSSVELGSKLKNKSIKTVYRWLHGSLGLISGLVVFVLGITGFLYSFEKEIQEFTQSYRYFEVSSDHPNGEALLPSQLMEIAKQKLPSQEIHSIKYVKWQPTLDLQNQNWKQRAAEVIFYHSSADSTYYYKVFMNPYSGEILRVHNMLEGFFAWVLRGHFYLWLPAEIGKVVVAMATLIFFILIFLGLILWFPKQGLKMKNWKSRVWFKWSSATRWRRKNFDLHSIFGFYSFLGALILSITGLYYGFNWWAMMYYKLLGGEKEVFFEEPVAKHNDHEILNGGDKLLDSTVLRVDNIDVRSENADIRSNKTDFRSDTADIRSDTANYADNMDCISPKRKVVQLNLENYESENANVLDRVYYRYKSRLDTGVDVMMEIHPQEELNKCIEVSFNSSFATYGGAEYIFVHPLTLESQQIDAVYGSRKGRAFADKMMLWNYDIHTGGVWGWWGKLIMAIFSLLIATLPITGFLMWWGRRNKS